MRESPHVEKFPYDAYQRIGRYREALIEAGVRWDDPTRAERLDILLRIPTSEGSERRPVPDVRNPSVEKGTVIQ